MGAERRRRRWVLPVVLLAASGAVVAHRVRAARPVEAPPALPERTPVPVAEDPVVEEHPVGTAALRVPGRAVVTLVDPPAAAEPEHGPAGLPARPDGSSPDPAFTIKGSGTSRVYHPPTSPYYGRARAEVWFRTAADAEAAGFRPHRSRRRD